LSDLFPGLAEALGHGHRDRGSHVVIIVFELVWQFFEFAH